MSRTYTMTVFIMTDKQRKDGTCPLYYRLKVGSWKKEIPTGKGISRTDWDDKKHEPNIKTPAGLLMSKFITKRKSEFDKFTMEQEMLGKKITPIIAKSFFDEVPQMNLFKFWEVQISRWHGMNRAHNTIKSYRSALNIVKEFKPLLDFGDLDLSLIEDFNTYLTVDRGNSINGAFTKHKNFKTLLTQAVKKSYIKENPYKNYKIQSKEGTREYLSIEEVVQIMHYKVPDKLSHLNKVKDMFLFSCYTGLRYSDIYNLKHEDLKLDYKDPELRIEVVKTKRYLTIPLNSFALEIINCYKLPSLFKGTAFLFPRITNQALNRELKDLMAEAKINKVMTFHCARHTFATNLLETDVPLMQVKELLGHTDTKPTLIYAKVMKKDLIRSVSVLDKFYRREPSI